jgi:hypothetical protein
MITRYLAQQAKSQAETRTPSDSCWEKDRGNTIGKQSILMLSLATSTECKKTIPLLEFRIKD